jgi:hypothetical protein
MFEDWRRELEWKLLELERKKPLALYSAWYLILFTRSFDGAYSEKKLKNVDTF